jgi:hypothetical protein
MRLRDFTIGLLLASAAGTAQAQEPAKQHRIAVVVSAGPAASISDTGVPLWQAFFAELRRLSDVEGQNCIPAPRRDPTPELNQSVEIT